MRRRLALASVGLLSLIAGCRTGVQQSRIPRTEQGQAHFQNYCAACHQYDDQGMGSAPPLAGASWVTGPEDRLIKIVLHGVRGPMEVAGKTYDLEMPGFGQILSDASIASLLSYVRRRFGGPGEAVTPEAVKRVREANQTRTEYWTAQELLGTP